MLDRKDRGAVDGAIRELEEETGVTVSRERVQADTIGEPDVNKPKSVREARNDLAGRSVEKGALFIVTGQTVVIQADPEYFREATAGARGQDDLQWAGVVKIADIARTPEEQQDPSKVTVRSQDLKALREAGLIAEGGTGRGAELTSGKPQPTPGAATGQGAQSAASAATQTGQGAAAAQALETKQQKGGIA